MNAKEACELMHGSMKKKGLFFKVKLAWMCGRINKMIEKEAELGEKYLVVSGVKQETAKQCFPLLAQMYENLGFFVAYVSRYVTSNELVIIWDFDGLKERAKLEFTNRLKHYEANIIYDYHTKSFVYEKAE